MQSFTNQSGPSGKGSETATTTTTTMSIPKEEQWQMLALVYRHSTNLGALRAAVPEWSHEKLDAYIKSHRLSARRRIRQGVYGQDGPSALMREMRIRKTFDKPKKCRGHSRPVTQVCQVTSCPPSQNKKRIQSLSAWLAHTHNIHVAQNIAQVKYRGQRPPRKNYPLDCGPLLSKVMLFVSQEEEHPPPASSSDPDYSEIYRYLSQVLAGQEPSQVSQGSAAKILEMISRVQKVAGSSHGLQRLMHHLGQNLSPCLKPWKKQADCSASARPQEERPSNTEECPLFQEVEEEKDLGQLREEMKSLAHGDPRYEVLKERVLKKRKENQAAASSAISNIPGINPFLLPPHHLFNDSSH